MKILLIRLRLIGDVVFTTPIIRALKRAMPDAHLSYLVERESAAVVAVNPNLDEVIVIRGGRKVAEGTVDDVRHQARQPFRVQFAGQAPHDELRSLPHVADLEVRGGEVTGVLTGSPDELIGLLSSHAVLHLTMPEPDLEDAFLQYYESSGR